MARETDSDGGLINPKPLDKTMSEMFDSTPCRLTYDWAKVLTLWPQTRGELQGYANYLEHHHAAITADQIRLAVALADKEFERLAVDSLPSGFWSDHV